MILTCTLFLPMQVANAKVLDVLRQMSTFELSMMRLDIRQVGGERGGGKFVPWGEI